MQNSLSISVIVITRNRAEWLKDTLSSLASQSRQPDEVILVDNASADHTKEVALSFSDKLNIKYIYEAKRGIPHARNTGVRQATGDIIASLDDDCIADENWLKYIEIPFIKNPNVGMVGGEISYYTIGDGTVEKFYKENMIRRRRAKKQAHDNTDSL